MVGSADLTQLSNDTFRSLLMEFIEQRLQTKDFEVNINAAAKNGDNFIGIVQRVTYNKTAENGQNDGEIDRMKLILKTAPTNVARREAFMSRACFLREIHLYDEVSDLSILI